MTAATFYVEQDASGRHRLTLRGQWSLRALENDFAELRVALAPFFADPFTHWDLREVEQLDTAGAGMLWTGWGEKLDHRFTLTDEQMQVFSMLSHLGSKPKSQMLAMDGSVVINLLLSIGRWAFSIADHVRDFLQLLGLLGLEFVYLIKRPKDIPWRELSANMYKSGVTALPVSALLGFMIGVAMSYLMSRQLRAYGADIFIINVLGLGVVRELGPMLMAVLIAGRSGSAMTAQIGVMRVTEEIDALTTMGISKVLRVIFPKVLGLTLVAPLLVLWTSFCALVGGALSAYIELGISFRFFFDYLPFVVQSVNLTLSMMKGFMFGLVVTLVACHYGLRIKPNTESLSVSTTSSVVTSITAVILIDAGFAIMSSGIGV